MEYLFNGIWTMMDVVFFYLFWNAFFQSKKGKKQSLVVLTIMWVGSILNASLIHNQILKQVFSLAVYFGASLYVNKGHWYWHILCLFLGVAVTGMVDTLLLYGVSALMGISYSDLIWKKMLYLITVSISKLIAVLLAWTMKRFRCPSNYRSIQYRWLVLALLFPTVSLFMLAVVFYGFQRENDLSLGAFIFSCIVAVANIAIVYLIELMEKSTREAQENTLLHQRMDAQADSIIALERSYRKQRQLTHDFQNQLQTIYDLLLRDDPSVAKDYVRQLQGMQTTRILAINSHNSIVDAVLNHKYQTAKELGIDFQVHVTDLSKISIDTNSMVVLLSNLLDNAIEACARIPINRTIQCSILAEDTVFISIRNTSVPVAIIGNTIPTTKDPREEHGFGIPHILLILNQLQAEYSFVYEDGWFEFVSEIPAEVAPTT